MTTEHSMREICQMLQETIGAREDVPEIHTGPRSNELWFKHRDGREVRLALQVIEPPV